MVILGANFGAKIARQLIAAPGTVRVAGVCDLDQPKAHALANELNVSVYASLDQVLADPNVEAVGVFTGPIGRARLIECIIQAGKHVMTTKPFELDPAEAARAFAAAEQHRRVLHLNCPAPVPAADLAAIREWLASADLGRPVALLARTWGDYHEVADGSWMDDPARCPGGPLFRLGVYFLNDFAGLLGRPTEVHVQHARVRTGRPTPDNAQISIAYEGGALATILTSFCVRDGQPYRDDVEIACERGTIRRWMIRSGDLDMSRDHAVVELQRAGHPVRRVVTATGDYAGWYAWPAFQAAVRGLPGSVPHNASETIAGVRLLAALSRAALSGETVRL
jgi:predicted dehydrogenase